MHALFFMSDSLQLEGVEDRSIHIFETEEAANAWLMEKLIGAGVVTHVPEMLGEYVYQDHFYELPCEVLEAIRDDYEGEGEYLHVYPAVDHR